MTLVNDEISRISDAPPRQLSADRSMAGSLLRSHMPGLDMLRGLAIVIVVIFHGFFYSEPLFVWRNSFAQAIFQMTGAGWIGVNLFFVLSGFLITGNLMDARERPNYYSRFYIRRALRILPIYLLVLLLLGVTGFISPKYIGVCVLFLANMPGLFLHGAYLSYPPLWSLAVEEQFYLAWPWIYVRLKRKGLTALCVALMIVCPLLRAAALSHILWTGDIFSKTWMIADNLAVGALIALLVRTPGVTVKALTRAGAVTALVCAGGLALLLGSGHSIKRDVFGGSVGFSLIGLLCAGCLILVLVAYSDRPLQRSLRWLVFFGDISYGLYLIHMFCEHLYDRFAGEGFRSDAGAMWLRFVVANGVAILLAVVSKRWFENPIMRLKNRIPAAR